MSEADTVPAPPAAPERADLSAWLAVAAGTLGAFMALLDVSVVNAALPIIQGEIGATQAEGTWVSTSYLVAEIVIMPLTAWLERIFGLRRVLLFGAILFTVFSVICGFASDLTTLILGRVGQGLAGGTLIPTGMTIMAKRLPPRQQSIGMALFAAAALMGPILGPLAGGWITENYSWRYIFFINVPICTGLVLLILGGLAPEKGDLSEFSNADWFGVAGMMIGLGSATVLLEEGHREHWFESALILRLAVASVVGFALVAVGQIWARAPVMKLSLLRDRGLASVATLTAVSGALLFQTLFTVPQFLAAIADYNAYQAGQVLFIAGGISIVGALLYPLLIAHIDIRLLVGAALVMAGIASLMSSNLTADSAGGHFVWGLLFLGLGVTFSVIPLQQAAIASVSVEDSGEATSIFNISRNIGAAVGLAFLAGFLDQRMEFHHWRIHSSLGANDPEVLRQLTETSAMYGTGPQAQHAAFLALDGRVMSEAMVMTFGDIFLMLAVLAFLSAPLAMLLRPLDPERAKGMMH